MATKQVKPPESNPLPQIGVPAIPAGTQNHDFHTQAVFNIHGQVAKLEIGLDHVDKRLEKLELKLDGIASQLTAMNTTMTTLQPIIKWLARSVWAIVTGIVGFGLTMLGMWTKHHYGW